MADTDATRRRQILQRVKATPGVNLRQVQRYTGIPLSSTMRLLDELESEGRLTSEAVSNTRRFFLPGKALSPTERIVLGFVNKPRPRRILEAVVASPGVRHGDLAEQAGLQAPMLTYYMKQMVDEGVVEGEWAGVERHYRVKNAALVRRALDRTRGGFQEAKA